jgi:hypothetical protein
MANSRDSHQHDCDGDDYDYAHGNLTKHLHLGPDAAGSKVLTNVNTVPVGD